MIIDRRVGRAVDVRDHIIDTLRRELVGPAPGCPLVQLNGEEILRPQDPPRYRYSCGILFPRGVTYSGSLDAREEVSEIEAAEPVTGEDSGEIESIDGQNDPPGEGPAGETETEVDPSSMFLPSTMGVSFLADVSGGLSIRADWGTYSKEKVAGYPQYRRDGKVPELWFRQPGTAVMEVSKNDLEDGPRVRRLRKIVSSPEDVGQLVIDIVSRSWSASLKLVTVTILNISTSARPINEHCFFQCGFAVTPRHPSRFLAYPNRPEAMQDPEERSLALLYRHRPNFAVGHGCAADWSVRDGVLEEIRTEVLPSCEQLPIVPRETLHGVELSMKVLSEANRVSLVAACRALAVAYGDWIKEREAELSSDRSLSDELRETGREHVRKCWDPKPPR